MTCVCRVLLCGNIACTWTREHCPCLSLNITASQRQSGLLDLRSSVRILKLAQSLNSFAWSNALPQIGMQLMKFLLGRVRQMSSQSLSSITPLHRSVGTNFSPKSVICHLLSMYEVRESIAHACMLYSTCAIKLLIIVASLINCVCCCVELSACQSCCH